MRPQQHGNEMKGCFHCAAGLKQVGKWAAFFLNFLIQYDSYLDIYFSSDQKYLTDVMNVVIILNETCGGDINATLRTYYYDNTQHYE